MPVGRVPEFKLTLLISSLKKSPQILLRAASSPPLAPAAQAVARAWAPPPARASQASRSAARRPRLHTRTVAPQKPKTRGVVRIPLREAAQARPASSVGRGRGRGIWRLLVRFPGVGVNRDECADGEGCYTEARSVISGWIDVVARTMIKFYESCGSSVTCVAGR